MAAALRDEVAAQAERWALWSPVALGCGAAIYFALPAEPRLDAALVAAALAIALAIAVRVWGRSHGLLIVAALIAFGVCGFAAARLRTARMTAPIAPAGLGVASIEGWVVDVSGASRGGGRLIIAPVWISKLSPQDTPARIRLTAPPDGLVGPGSAVRVTAMLNPPPGPASPGAYDFARDAFFNRIGASGLALTTPAVISLPKPPFGLRAFMALNSARWTLSRRIVGEMGEAQGGVAAAMVTGHEAWLSQEEVQAMRDSGLAHILSISGLHMAIVGGFVFFLVRLGVAAWPWLALRVAGKKLAAAAGLFVVIGYLVLSGWPPPAQRSALTAVIAFGAILLDRRALSLRALAIAALLVLLWQPEAIVQPGFQMSFAATTALVAMAEVWPHGSREINAPWPIVLFQRARGWLVAGLAASFVAGTATTPFAIHHFNRVAIYGLPANLLSEPLSSLVIMPALALGALGEALTGSAGPFLMIAGWGLERLNDLARLFAALPYAVQVTPSAPGWTLSVSFLGLLLLCLWRGRLRWLGLPLFAAVMLWPRPPLPAAWVAGDGANAVVRDGRKAVVLRPGTRTFAVELWAHRRGLTLPSDPDVASAAAFDCNRKACTPKPDAPLKLAGWWGRRPPDEQDLEPLCSVSEVLVLRSGEPPPGCRARLIIRPDDFERGGAAELYRAKDGWRVVWAQTLRGDRPWSRASDSED